MTSTAIKPDKISVGVTLKKDFRFINEIPNAIKRTKNFFKNLNTLNTKITMMPLLDCLIGCEKSVISIYLGTDKIVNIFRF